MQIYIRLFVAAMLILLSAALVVKSKKRVYPLSLVLACLGIFVSISTVRNPSALAEKEDNTAGDYLFLAESAMSAGSLDQAEEYLKALYSHCGETPEGTLAYARLAILRNDYVGAAVLYGKLDTLGKSEVFDETDKKIYEKLKDGTTTDRITA
ncbi:MAG: hypothetical protein II188_03180, partial [Ruminococcus sp.]|nr:hypothetical protein [Ruminococcus sp.]